MKTNLYYGCVSAAEVQLRFEELNKIFNNEEEMLQAIKNEYSTLMSVVAESKMVEPKKEATFTVSDIIRLVQERFNPEGLKLELTGTWIWLSGTGTFAIKEGLKQLGFRYSVNKQSWYWRSEEDRSVNAKPVPLDLIRKKYGSSEVSLG